MATTTIRVKTETREMLRELADASGMSMQRVLDEALDQYRRQTLLAETNAAYARLQAAPEAWSEWMREREEWDQTIADGLETE